MTISLETKRLWLRSWTLADVDNLIALDSDPEVLRWTNPGGECAPRSEYEDHILPRFMAFEVHSPGFGYWAAVEKPSGMFLGWFHFRAARDSSGDIELGYRLLPCGRNRGYATEASQALIDKGFTELGVRRVVATTLEGNRASRRVMEKVGLQYVETFVYPGINLAGVKYALDKPAWDAAHPKPLSVRKGTDSAD